MKCFHEITGKDIRIECKWSNYLDENFHPEYRVCTDTCVLGDVCLKYRPDGMWASAGMVLQWECDERQHQGTKYDCDEDRINSLYDEFPGKQYIIVRVNPDGYTAPNNTKKPERAERKRLMVQVMDACLTKEWDTNIHIVYMFYSADNPNITSSHAKTLLFDKQDVDNFCCK
jgi:hypothetical protein